MNNNDLDQQLEQIEQLDTDTVIQIGRRQRQLKRDRNPIYKIVRVDRTKHASNKSKRRALASALVERAEAFAAFVVIVESKGLPAHVIDETKLAVIAIDERWDMVPFVLAHLIREDEEVRAAFHEFSHVAKKCESTFVRGTNLIASKVNELVSTRYREVFLHAASAYARKLSKLESSIDRLSYLPLADLESLVADGDDLARQIAAIGVKISDEIKRRDAKKGANAKSQKLDPVREYAVKLANEKSYPSRRQAVLAIKDRVVEYANSLDSVSMSADQALNTIDGWLKRAGYTPSAGKQGMSAG
ncbi:hypothetical protein [Burkholderia multivorans]|uniref:hypothetical protein n=1 Tax=Burkholderia multivorans TaxID=87883 RepID=UPI0021C1A5BD|nr:hypothetical protein [Burkholderia multivorans]